MAQVALLTKGIVYDTSRQVVTLHQVVERFMLGDSLCEKCIVTEIMFDEHAGYTYTLIGTQEEQKKFIGNAVEVNMARVLCEALVAKLYELNIVPQRFAA